MTTKEYHREWARKNKERRIELNTAWRNKKILEFKKLKENLRCERCQFSHPAALVFHHKDPEKKEINIGVAHRRWSTKRLSLELEKCEVLCSNCHAIEHWDTPVKQSPSSSTNK